MKTKKTKLTWPIIAGSVILILGILGILLGRGVHSSLIDISPSTENSIPKDTLNKPTSPIDQSIKVDHQTGDNLTGNAQKVVIESSEDSTKAKSH